MTDHKPPYSTKVAPGYMHRMVTDYEKRGMTTAHLREAMERTRTTQAPASPTTSPPATASKSESDR